MEIIAIKIYNWLSLWSLNFVSSLFVQAAVYFGLSPYVGQSAGTTLDVKAWQDVSYSLLTKAPCQGFTSKTRRMRVLPNIGCLSRFMFLYAKILKIMIEL